MSFEGSDCVCALEIENWEVLFCEFPGSSCISVWQIEIWEVCMSRLFWSVRFVAAKVLVSLLLGVACVRHA